MEYLASSPSFATFRDDSLSPLVLETRKVESEMDSDRPNFPRICHYSFSRKYKVFDRRQVVGTLTIGQWLFARTWAASWPSRDYEFVASGIDANRMKKKKKKKEKKEARRPLNALDLFSFKRIPSPLLPSRRDGWLVFDSKNRDSFESGGKSCFPPRPWKKNVLLISRYGTGDSFFK